MSSFVTRLQEAVSTRNRGNPQICTVSRADLRELLHHFERLDNDARAAYEQDLEKKLSTKQERQS